MLMLANHTCIYIYMKEDNCLQSYIGSKIDIYEDAKMNKKEIFLYRVMITDEGWPWNFQKQLSVPVEQKKK